MSYLRQVGVAAGTSASTTTLPVVAVRPAKVGQTILLAIASGASASNDASFGATDSRGNTWTELAHRYKSGTCQISLLRCDVTTELKTNDTVTISHAATGATFWAAWSGVFDDLGTVDSTQSLVTDGTSGTSLTVGTPSGAPAQAAQLVVCGFVVSNTADYTFSSGWNGESVRAGTTTSGRNIGVTFKYVNDLNPRAATVTTSNSSVWAGFQVAFNSVVQPQTILPAGDLPSGSSMAAALADDDVTTVVSLANADVKTVSLNQVTKPADLSSVYVGVEGKRVGATAGSFVMKLVTIDSGGATTVVATSSSFTCIANIDRYVWNIPSSPLSGLADADWGRLGLQFVASVTA